MMFVFSFLPLSPMKKSVWIIIVFCSFLYVNCSPSFEEEVQEGGAAILSFSWSGDVEKFSFDKVQGIRLNDSGDEAGTACIAYPSTSVRRTS